VRALLLVIAASAVLSAQVDTQALPRMVATERAFAAATEEIGVRDGFLTFFADDAASLDPGATGAAASVSRAKDGLVKLAPAKLPVLARLMWQPFTGQISEDATLGWLTGPYVVLNQLSKEIDRKGAYFSVWKRQPDGTYRVWLDEGIALPEVWNGASEFRAAPAPDAGTAGAPGESLDDAERAVAAGGDPWTARLAESVRLHREGVMPIAGRDFVRQWVASAWSTMRYTLLRTERAASGDLGIALGGYDGTSTSGPQHGTWVRVWHRDVTNRWRIVFETSKQAK
jgi:ketosteroid isomerase-like protein